MHFSLVFTREDTNSLPVTETNVNGTEGELVVTPEVIASNINNVKNTSPGVYGIAHKTQKETVKQISM